jgi:hypothetical protein
MNYIERDIDPFGEAESIPENPIVRRPPTILEKYFFESGMGSTLPNERIFRSNKDEPDVLGNNTFVFNNGNPILYRAKRLYLEPKSDGTNFEVKWIMDTGEGLLNVIQLTTRNGNDILELALQHPFDPSLCASVTYEHGYFDSRSIITPEYSAPSQPLISFNKPDPDEIILSRELSTDDEDRVIIAGIANEPRCIEQITFPKQIKDSMTWVTRFEAGWEDATAEPTEPWKNWFTELGIHYSIHM